MFQVYKALVKKQNDKVIKILHTNNGGEYFSLPFKASCIAQGILHQFTIPYTFKQNGITKWKNQTFVKVARNMLQIAQLFKSFWIKAISTTCYIQNQIPISTQNIPPPMKFEDTVVIRLSPHLDLGVLMRTYPNVADLALYCSSL
jgi:transposase InsO family protein